MSLANIGFIEFFLLCFLIEYKRRENKDFPLLAVHVNHGIRGDEAKRDEEFSRSFAESVGVEFESYFVDVPKISSEIGAGLEETARNARYSIFNEIRLFFCLRLKSPSADVIL